MTADHLQRIVLRLANLSYVRYWLNYGDRHENVLMAIQSLVPVSYTRPGVAREFAPARMLTLEQLGFIVDTSLKPDSTIYTIPRTNDDGTPYVSKLF